MNIGFDNDKYIKLQSEKIQERLSSFGGKLYLEFGGKLFDDYHASRVLPGFCPDSKIKMLLKLKDDAEVIIVVSATSIEQNKIRGDLGISYDMDTLRMIDAFNEIGLLVGGVVITQYTHQPSVDLFMKRLDNLGIKIYRRDKRLKGIFQRRLSFSAIVFLLTVSKQEIFSELHLSCV